MLQLLKRCVLFALSATIVCAQTPSQNTNMVSGTTFPGGDPFLQRQNEPSVAVSTRNPQHLLAGANDYRTVDLPANDALPDNEVTGDAWLGVFKSFDGGLTWRSTLLPGFPQDTSKAGIASPIKGFKTAADPVVRAGTNGMFYYSGVAFNRGTNQGVVFVSRFIDLNNKENGNVVQGTDSIKYLSAFIVDKGSAGQFLDKPWLAVDIPRGTATCSIQVPQDGRIVSQTIPAGNVYMAYTVLVGNDNNIRTKLYLSRSLDCGATWGQPTKLSEGLPVNQGANVAVDPKNGYVYVVWRGFATNNTLNTINIVRSTDGGATFTKANTIKSLPTYSDSNPSAPSFFDQGTTAGSFRTNAFPAMAVDGNGRVYVAWSQRGIAGSDARIVVTSSADFTTWTTPQPIDNGSLGDDFGATFTTGHQFMPTVTFSDGRLMMLYYDERFDHTVGLFAPNDPFLPEPGTGKFYKEKRDPRGELKDGTPFQTPFVSDFGLTEMRHTIEVRVSQAVPTPNGPLSFTSARVSEYKFGVPSDATGTNTELEQLQINPPNLPLFQQGTVPFIGDYIDIAGLSMVKPANAPWKFNTDLTPAPQHVATYTSNQDVRPPADGDWTHYTALGTAGPSLYDGTQRPACAPGQEGMRNQNIYSSVITQGLKVAAQQNAKPLNLTVPREFVLTVQNQTNFDKHFRITIGAQPAGGVATFLPIPNPIPNPLPSPLTILDVDIAAHSGIARGVYALSTSATASIPVTVTETGVPNGTQGLTGAVLLNADPAVAALADPDGSTGVGISSAEIYNPNVSNPNVSNPNVSNPNVSNPNVSNPNVSNPNVSNPNVSNPNVSNLDVANPNVSNPNVSNPNVSNPNVSNPNVSNQNLSADDPVTDATYTVTNSGNTTAAYTVKIVGDGTASGPLQLIISKPYTNPTASNCTMLEQSNNVVLSNVNNPVVLDDSDLTDSEITNPNVSNPTVSIPPGESVLVTLRGYIPFDEMKELVTQVTPVIVSQAPNTNDPTNTPAVATPLFIRPTRFASANAGQPYSAQLFAIGGTAPYTWTVDSGSLPPGFALDSGTGVISNADPEQNVAGKYGFVVRVTDSGSPAVSTTTRAVGLTVIGEADLVIDQISHTPKSPTTADDITITALVKNRGFADAPASSASITLPGEEFGAELPVPALAPGQIATITRVVNDLAAGDYTANASADILNQVTESNEENNGASDSFTIQQAQPALVLSIDEFNNPVAGTQMNITVVTSSSEGGTVPEVQVTLVRSWDPTPLTAISNSDGRAVFTFTAPAEGAGYKIEATGSLVGFTSGSASATFDSIAPAMALSFQPPVSNTQFADSTMTVTVVAMDPTGAVLPNVQLKLSRSWDPTPLTAVTNDQGVANFSFTVPAVGTGYVITVTGTAPGFSEGTVSTSFSSIPPIL